jgi:hypothetical protein
MCTDGSASKLGNACKAALVQRTATAKVAVVQRQQQQRRQQDSDIAKMVVPAKMIAPEKAAAQAQQSQQRWQWRSCSTSKVGSKDGSASKGGSTSKGSNASKFGSATGLASQARQEHIPPSICPRHSESTNKGMPPPPPQHMNVKQPPGEPPRLCERRDGKPVRPDKPRQSTISQVHTRKHAPKPYTQVHRTTAREATHRMEQDYQGSSRQCIPKQQRCCITVQWRVSAIRSAKCIQESQIQQCLVASQWRVSTQGYQSGQYLATSQQRVAGSSKRQGCATVQ